MKKIYLLLIALTALSASAQTTIDFNDANNWTSTGSGYLNHTYEEGVFSFTSINNYRESANALGGSGYASRLQNNSSSELTATIASGGVDAFSVQVRAWDNSPSPDFALEYSVNAGTSWVQVATINNTSLNNDTEYVSFGATIANPNDNILIRFKSNGTTERIIIDNFTWSGFSSNCGITYGTTTYTCNTNTIGDNNDSVIINIPYSGIDAAITDVTTTSTGTIGGDNPAIIENGTITISGLSEGDSWDINLAGGDCAAIIASGIVPANQCDPSLNTCFDISNGTEKFEIFNAETSTVWEENSGVYSANGYCGSGCEEAVNGWLVFGPLDISAVSGLLLQFDAYENYSDTPLAINYTSNYDGCPSNTAWTNAQTLTGSYEGAEVDLSAATGTAFYIGIQYLDDGADGYSDWQISNVQLATYGACPVLGTRTAADCSTLSTTKTTADVFSIYPNPTTNGLVNITSKFNEAISVTVFDILGKQVFNRTVTNNTLNVASLNSGVYILKISQNGNVSTKRLVIK